MRTVTSTGVYRLAAHDAGVLLEETAHVLRVRKDVERYYWIDLRSRHEGNAWTANGVELRWNSWHQAIGTSQLLDTTPGSIHGLEDAALVIGRTYSDAAAGVHIISGRGPRSPAR